jgi:poly-gamma-glutamate capsule biosynthesis protein CapA/YwtB (metallophosphatase superfamily)
MLKGQDRQSESRLSLMSFGDVNLGRAVGQELLKGNLDYPFKWVKDTLAKSDLVFVNLESQLSEQGGETQHPKYNLIFCGPPVGAEALKRANISVVSTANNHAFDYGVRALKETILNLQGAGIPFVGTSVDSVDHSDPVIVEREGMRIGFLAYTQFVNLKGPWIGRIALFEAQRARRDIDSLRAKVDIVVVSYHGGEEYKDNPSEKLRRDFRTLADAGADVVVGHHPHYVQGIEMYRGKLLCYSLGNFVFYQPQLEWTQFGLGVEIGFMRRGAHVLIDHARLLPLRAGLQPAFTVSSEEKKAFFNRLKKLSPAHLYEKDGAWFIRIQENND